MMVPEQLLGRTLVLVAHPDDEAVGGGVLLQRMREPIVVFATDGAPRASFFWQQHGSRHRYAQLRRQEAQAALALAGVSEIVFLADEGGAEELFVDQELYRCLRPALERLTGMIRRYQIEAVITMAYEGGHPDHDTCSFLGAMLHRNLQIPVWEFPLYHRANVEDVVFQQFPSSRDELEVVLEGAPEEIAIKRRMLAAYASQSSFLVNFDSGTERFRPQHAYDFTQLPPVGAINYEVWQWPITAREVCAAFAEFLRER